MRRDDGLRRPAARRRALRRPGGGRAAVELLTELTGESTEFAAVVEQAKREVIQNSLYAEVNRLVDLLVVICHDDIALRDHTRRQLGLCVVELLVAFDRYRAYVVPGEPAPRGVRRGRRARGGAGAAAPAGGRRGRARAGPGPRPGPATPAGGARGRDDAARRAEFVVRFQQTCGPVMAKGVEDTAFYRWNRLVALNEVGGDPGKLGVPPEEFHAFAGALQAEWPAAMTTLSTHDTKRSEDVRARLLALTELPQEWAVAVREWTEAAGRHGSPEGWPDASTAYLIWQTLVGTWGSSGPLAAQRLHDYLTKAIREAKVHTSWTRPDEVYENAVHALRRRRARRRGDPRLRRRLRDRTERRGPRRRARAEARRSSRCPASPTCTRAASSWTSRSSIPTTAGDVDFDARPRAAGAARRRREAGGPRRREAPRDLAGAAGAAGSPGVVRRRPTPTYVPLPTSSGNAIAFGRGTAGERARGCRPSRSRPGCRSRSSGTAAGRSTRSRCRRGRGGDMLTGRETRRRQRPAGRPAGRPPRRLPASGPECA